MTGTVATLPSTSTLSTGDLAMFRDLGIPEDLLALAHVQRITDFEARESFGIKWTGDLAGIVFPYYLNGHRVTARVRRDHPEIGNDGESDNKYISALGDRRHLFLPPDYEPLLNDPTVPLLFVESEKAVLAILAWSRRTSWKVLPLGTGGCWGWRGVVGIKQTANGNREPEKDALPEVGFARDRRVVGILFDSNARSNPKVRDAREALRRHLEQQGANVGVFELPQIEGVNGPDDYIGRMGDEAFLDLLNGKQNGNDNNDDPPGRIPITETSNAERLIREYGKDLRYVSDRGVWCGWNGECWAVNDIGGVMRRMQEVGRGIYGEASAEQDKERRAALAGWAKQSESRRVQDNSVAIARYFEGVEVRKFSDVFDTDPFLLNVKNGTVDLRTGKLHNHSRENYITKQIPIEYDPDADCPQFKKFLCDSLPHPGLADYIVRVFGYLLTGSMREQSWWIWYGPTGTGKSTLIRILLGILGPYAYGLPSDFFLDKTGTDFITANLTGVRLATSVETKEGKRLDVNRIKAITGEDVINASLKYQNAFQFVPQAKLILATNHRPHISASDDAIWRRTRPVSFDMQVPEDKKVAELAEKLLVEEGSGILHLMVQGCLGWQRNGIQEPDVVRQAAAEYREAEDIVADFLRDSTVRDADERVVRSELYKVFKKWSEENGFKCMSAKKFANELTGPRHGIDDSDPGKRYWPGVRIKQLGD